MQAEHAQNLVLCEGYNDRAFLKGCFVERLGWQDAPDLTEPRPAKGEFRFRRPDRAAICRAIPVRAQGHVGKASASHSHELVPYAVAELEQRETKPIRRLLLVVDADTAVGQASTAASGLRLSDVARGMRDSGIPIAENPASISVTDSGTAVYLVRWECDDPDCPELPRKQTLERLVSAAIREAYPARAREIHAWLGSRSEPPPLTAKEYAWSHMAGWYAAHGCDDFYQGLWRDPAIAQGLVERLRNSGAWFALEALAQP
jgi:hypothetical protein